MKILVIGTGMYVTGRNTDAYGTILPSIIEFQRNHKIKDLEVIFSGRNSSRLLEAKKKVLKAMKISGVKFKTTFCSNKKDYKNILKSEKKLVCAIIAVPDHLHFNVINECLNYNLHTLVVKPFTTKVFDAKKLIAKKVSKNLIGAVEFHKRFDKHNILLKNIYESQKLGDPLYFNVEYSQKKLCQKKYLKVGQVEQIFYNI